MITFEDLGLQIHADNQQYQDYLAALNQFVEEKSKEADITHIFVGGSFARGELQERSDLDCYVINPKMDVLLEEDLQIDDVKLDYLTMSEEVLQKSIEDGKGSNFRLFATGFLVAKRIYGDESIDNLILLAKEIVEAEIPAIPKETFITNAHFLSNQKTETERMLEKDDVVGFLLRTNHVIQCCIFYYFDVNRMPAVAWKKLSSVIKDEKLLGLVESALTETENKKKHARLCVLIDYSVEMMKKSIA